MKEYIYIVILLFMGIVFLDLKVPILKKIGKLIIGMIFFGIAGLGYKINSDWTVYEIIYNWINLNNSKYLELEVGYKYLNIIFNNWLSFYQFKMIFFLFCFILIYLGLKNFLKRNQIYLWFGLAYFYFGIFYNFYLSAMRQTIGISIFIFSLQYLIIKRDWKKYYFCIFIAALFHTSAIVLFLLYYIFNFKIKVKSLYLLPYYIFLFILLNNKLFLKSLINFVVFILGKIGIDIRDINYFTLINDTSIKYIIFILLLNIVLIFLYLKFTKRRNYLINKILLIFLVSDLLVYNIGIFYRIRLYFLPFYFIFLSYLLNLNRLKIFKYIFILIVILIFNIKDLEWRGRERGSFIPLHFVYEKIYKEIPEDKTAEYKNLRIRFGKTRNQLEEIIIRGYLKKNKI